MTASERIETYMTGLDRALRGLNETDRTDISKEIRAHLEHRSGENRLDEALKALGAPEACARGFIDELTLQAAFTDAGPSKIVGALIGLASRRLTAAAGLFVAGTFFLLAAGFAWTGVMEVVSPNLAGLWIDKTQGVFTFGTMTPVEPTTREVLGRWLIPVAAAVAVLSFVIGQTVGRFFIRLMMKRRGGRTA